MKIFLSVAIAMMVAVTLFECPRQSSAMPALPDCDMCKEVDISDDEHSICSFGCSYHLRTTLPVDASDDEQRDFADRILPILRLLRNIDPPEPTTHLTLNGGAQYQLNHETLEFEPLVHQIPSHDSSEEYLIPSSPGVEIPGFENYDGDTGEFLETEITYPHVLPAELTDYAVDPYDFQTSSGSQFEFTPRDPTLYPDSDNQDDELESILKFLGLTASIGQDESAESSNPMQEDSWSWNPFTQNTDEDTDDILLPSPTLPPTKNINNYDAYQGDHSSPDTDAEEIIFVPLAKDERKENEADFTSSTPTQVSQQMQPNPAEMSNNFQKEEVNEIPDEYIDEITKKMIQAPKKPSLLDMYYVDDSYLVESKRSKKDI